MRLRSTFLRFPKILQLRNWNDLKLRNKFKEKYYPMQNTKSINVNQRQNASKKRTFSFTKNMNINSF